MSHPLHKTIKGKFLITILILMFIIGIGVATFSFLFYYNNLRANTIQATEINLNFISDNINQRLDKIYSLGNWCQTNTSIIKFVMTSPEESKNNDYSSVTGTAKDLLMERYLYNDSNSYIQRIVIANQNRQDYLQYVDSPYSVDRPMVSMITELPFYHELLDSKTYTFTDGFQKIPFIRYNAEMLPVIRPIFHPYKTDCIGFVYIEIAPKLFCDSVSDYTSANGSTLFLTIGNSLYELDGYNYNEIRNPEINSDNRFSDLLGKNTYVQTIDTQEKKLLVLSRPLNTTGCYISHIIPSNVLRNQLNGYFSILLIIALIISLIGIALYYSLTRTVTNPIILLRQRLQIIAQGDFTKEPDIEWDNELGDMGRNVNQLALDIEKLMEQRIEDERQKRDYEYQLLQSQIKPHFIYNTLNSIKWMATAQHATGIAEMVTAFSHLLKNIAKGTSTLVTIRNEIDLLNDYFIIQKYRYGGSITLSYDIEDETIYDNLILRFTLQPIVENAIFHGIEPKGYSGTIQIKMYTTSEDDICIEITDDGIGVEEEKIASIMSDRNQSNSHVFRDVGIYSVSMQLKHNFGEKYGISIKSKPLEYTTMSILLPKNE